MADDLAGARSPLLPEDAPPRRTGHAWLAWVVIVLAVLGAAGWQMARPTAEDAAHEDRLGMLLMEIQARYLVGVAKFLGQAGSQPLASQAQALNTGPIDRRWRFIVIEGELA